MGRRPSPDVLRADVGHAELEHAGGERETGRVTAYVSQCLERDEDAACRGPGQLHFSGDLAQRHVRPGRLETTQDVEPPGESLDEIRTGVPAHPSSLHASEMGGRADWPPTGWLSVTVSPLPPAAANPLTA